MAELDQIEQSIARSLDAVLETRVANSRSDREWTIAVKRTIGDLGLKLGYRVCASDPKRRFEPEWLFDLVWYTYDRQAQLTEIGLIVEIEWAMSYEPIKWDFEKLLVGRADHRVLIFQATSSRTIENYCRRLIREITTFEHSLRGDRYLFAAFDQKTERFVYRGFEY